MTTTETSPDEAAVPTETGGAAASILSWVAADDHKKIGRAYLILGTLGLLATVVLNVIINVERVDGTDKALDQDAWTQLLDAQRIGLVFGSLLGPGVLVEGRVGSVDPLDVDDHVEDDGGDQAERPQDQVEAADLLVVVGGHPGQDRRPCTALAGVGAGLVTAGFSAGHTASGLTW